MSTLTDRKQRAFEVLRAATLQCEIAHDRTEKIIRELRNAEDAEKRASAAYRQALADYQAILQEEQRARLYVVREVRP